GRRPLRDLPERDADRGRQRGHRGAGRRWPDPAGAAEPTTRGDQVRADRVAGQPGLPAIGGEPRRVDLADAPRAGGDDPGPLVLLLHRLQLALRGPGHADAALRRGRAEPGRRDAAWPPADRAGRRSSPARAVGPDRVGPGPGVADRRPDLADGARAPDGPGPVPGRVRRAGTVT